jgi:hypothetical protein
MSATAIPAFFAAYLRHFSQLLQEGVPGPYLSSAFQHNASSSLFSDSFHQAQAAFELRQAAAVTAETDIHLPNIIPDIILPHLCLFQEADITSAVAGVSKLLSKATKFLTTWYRETCPTRQEFTRLRQAYPSLDTRLVHLSPSILVLTNPLTFTTRSQSDTSQMPSSRLYCLPSKIACLNTSLADVTTLTLLLGLPIVWPYTIYPGFLSRMPLWTESGIPRILQVELQAECRPS